MHMSSKFFYMASGGQGAFLKNRPLDPQKTFYCPSGVFVCRRLRSDEILEYIMSQDMRYPPAFCRWWYGVGALLGPSRDIHR
jgi:hypothetical protein